VITRLLHRRAEIGLAAAILLGVALRFIWPADMEFKRDEMFLYHHATGPHPFPWLGQGSGVGTVNAGMGIWVYSLMAKAIHLVTAHVTPIQLVHGVMALNVIALVGLAAFAVCVVPGRQREPWLWAAALVAVNPLAVLFSRKLWIQSALPPFVMAALLAWWHRRHRAGAFGWGLIGAWLGQIHLTGFFFAAGLAAWTALFERRSVRWRWWLFGSLLGALTLVPWLTHTLSHPGAAKQSLDSLWPPHFWIFWVSNTLGLSLLSLPVVGSPQGFHHGLLAWPSIGGSSLYLVTIMVGVISAVAVAIAIQAVVLGLWPRRHRLHWLLAGRGSDTGLAVSAAFWGFGLLLTATGELIYRHYLIVAYALPFVFLALAALVHPRHGRILLTVLVLSQAALSVLYLDYVHVRGRAVGGDYGVPYDRQTHAARRREAGRLLEQPPTWHYSPAA
jgi:hypothetical protein